MKKRFLPLSMLLITIVLAQASFVANAAGVQGKYTPRTGSKATISSFMKSIRANQETGLIDPADMIAAQKAAQAGTTRGDMEWTYAGPDNFGGLTKGVIYNADGTVLIGTMGGNIFKTTNGGITFRRITNMNLPISCMVSDGNGNIFIGTGDGRDAQTLNGLSDLGYDASFIGHGIYKMAAGSTTPEHIASTTPSANNGWGYVNEMTYVNDKLYAATAAGIMMSTDNGNTWTCLIQGNFRSVKSNNAGDILAADEANVYLSKNNAEFVNVTDDIAANDNMKIIAMSPTNANYMYIAYLDGEAGNYSASNIYFTADGGTNWNIAVAGTSLYPMFSADANYEGFMIVYPNNPKKLLLGSDNLWVVEDVTGQGLNSYRPQQISEYFTDEYTAIAWNRYYYMHRGIQTIAFNPTNPNEFFVGTNGGVYKGEYYASVYSYKSGNRYFITEEEHTSTARMMSVGVGGMNAVLGGCLDHGTIGMEGSEYLNNVTTGTAVFPHLVANTYSLTNSYFDDAYAGGPCAISTIDPYVLFVSGTGSLTTPIFRSETGGADYNENFEGGGDNPVITNSNAFRTPFAFFENYNDANNPVDTIYAPIRVTKHVGDMVYAYSEQRGYPVDHIITEEPPHDTDHYINGEYVWIQGDTIRNIHDPLSSLYICGIEGSIYMTRDALIFNKATDWLLINAIEGIPTAVAISGDGDMALVGTVEGSLYKVTGLSNVYTEDDINQFVTFTTLNTTWEQAVTGISIDPANKNNILVSLGNYGNTSYIYRSTNGGTSFTSAQGNLPVAPVYSCLIEKSTGLFIAGTENGIYISDDNGTSWTKSGDVSCPVMDLKQAVQKNHDPKIDILYDEMGNATYVIYPGVTNEGMIYAATYGAGIISSSTFKEGGDLGVVENEETASMELNIYPNPVRDNGNINITLTESANVSYQIFDLSGRMVANSQLGYYGQGDHTLTFNVDNLASGSYIIRVLAGSKSETAKFLVY